MGTIRIVVADELLQDRAQVLFVQDNEVVEALAPQRPNHPFRHGVRAGSPDWGEQRLGPERPYSFAKLRSVRVVAIPEQLFRRCTPGSRLDDLLPDPSRSRVRRDVDVDEFTPVVGDEYHDIEGPERQGRHGEQIGRPDLGPMVGEERTPGLAR